MVKKCFYCRTDIEDNSVVDMCMKCMYQVWGEKMAKTIIENMEKEKGAGNLELGRVGEAEERGMVETSREIEVVEESSIEVRGNEGFVESENIQVVEGVIEESSEEVGEGYDEQIAAAESLSAENLVSRNSGLNLG